MLGLSAAPVHLYRSGVLCHPDTEAEHGAFLCCKLNAARLFFKQHLDSGIGHGSEHGVGNGHAVHAHLLEAVALGRHGHDPCGYALVCRGLDVFVLLVVGTVPLRDVELAVVGGPLGELVAVLVAAVFACKHVLHARVGGVDANVDVGHLCRVIARHVGLPLHVAAVQVGGVRLLCAGASLDEHRRGVGVARARRHALVHHVESLRRHVGVVAHIDGRQRSPDIAEVEVEAGTLGVGGLKLLERILALEVDVAYLCVAYVEG